MASSRFILNVEVPEASLIVLHQAQIAVQTVLNAAGKGTVRVRTVPNEPWVLIADGLIDCDLRDTFINGVCDMLKQDCLAYWDCDKGEGSIVGPRPEKYRPFDAAKFRWSFDQASANNPGRVLH